VVTKNILNLANDLQTVNLVNENYKESKKKKPNMIKSGIKNIIGISMIKVNSDLIASL
jgi:hypothetical protein